MKKLLTVFVVLMSLAMAGCLVEDNSAEITALKKRVEELKNFQEEVREPLAEIIIKKKLEDVHGVWDDRVYSRVSIWEESKEMVVSVTTANGEGEFKDEKYVHDILSIILNQAVEEISWLKDFKVTLQII